MLHLPNIFGSKSATPSPPPPEDGSPVTFTNDPNVPLASHASTSTPQAPGAYQEGESFKELGYQGGPAAGLQSETFPSGIDSKNDSSSASNLESKDSAREDKMGYRGIGNVANITETKTSVPFGDKPIDFSSPAQESETTGVESSQSPSSNLTDLSSAVKDQDIGDKSGDSGIAPKSTPSFHDLSRQDRQEMPVNPNVDKSLASDFGQMSMEERRIAEKQPLLDEGEGEDGKNKSQDYKSGKDSFPSLQGLGGSTEASSHPTSGDKSTSGNFAQPAVKDKIRAGISPESTHDEMLGSKGPSKPFSDEQPRSDYPLIHHHHSDVKDSTSHGNETTTGGLPGFGAHSTSQTHHDDKSPSHLQTHHGGNQSHLTPNVSGVKTHHSAPSSTRSGSVDDCVDGGSLDEAGNKKPTKKVGLGDKLAGAFEKLIGSVSHDEAKRLHGETRQHEGKEAADALVASHSHSHSPQTHSHQSQSHQTHSKGMTSESGSTLTSRHANPQPLVRAPESERIHSNLHETITTSSSSHPHTSGQGDIFPSEIGETGRSHAVGAGIGGGNGAAEVGGVGTSSFSSSNPQPAPALQADAYNRKLD